MDTLDYLKTATETSKSLRDLSISLSHISNDIDNIVFKKERLHIPGVATGQSMGSLPTQRRSDVRNNYSSFNSSMSVNTRPSILKKTSQFSTVRPSSSSIYRPPVRDFSSANSLSQYRSSTNNLSSTDFDAYRYFPVTLGNSYLRNSISSPLDRSMSFSQDFTGTERLGASYSATSPRLAVSGKLYDYEQYEDPSDTIDDLQNMILGATDIVASGMPNMSPYEEYLLQLKLKRLRIEKDRLLEIKRQEELERMKGPTPRWYEKRDNTFHHESHKNTKLIRHQDKWSDMLRRREQLLRESMTMNALYAS